MARVATASVNAKNMIRSFMSSALNPDPKRLRYRTGAHPGRPGQDRRPWLQSLIGSDSRLREPALSFRRRRSKERISVSFRLPFRGAGQSLSFRPPVSAACDYASVAYDEGLAARLLDMLGDEPGRTQKKMFGGLAVLVGGHMAVGVYGDGLLVHTDPGEQATLLAEPGTRPFDMSGRPMKGWILVDASVCSEDHDLRRWVARGVAHARSLPPK